MDDAYAHLNPRGQSHESLKKLTGSEILTLVLFQQLRGVESARSFLRDVQRFFVHLFPGVAGMHPSSLQRRVRKLRRLEWNPCAGRSCLRLRLVIRRCVNPECEFYRHSHRPEQEGAFALPQGEFGLDVIALVGALRHAHHRSVPEIHREPKVPTNFARFTTCARRPKKSTRPTGMPRRSASEA